VPVIVIVYVPTWLAELVNHETTLETASNVMKDVEVNSVGGLTEIEYAMSA
jgi:hypothetical protein